MAIQKDPSKAPVPSCGVHSLTCYVMNYISFLADYSGAFVDIVVYWLLNLQTPLPESYFGSPSELNDSPVSIRFAWRIVCHGSPPHQRDSSLPPSLSLSLFSFSFIVLEEFLFVSRTVAFEIPRKFWAWNDISLYLLHCLVAKKVRENRKEKKIFFYLDF